jgi:hypothetical protein
MRLTIKESDAVKTPLLPRAITGKSVRRNVRKISCLFKGEKKTRDLGVHRRIILKCIFRK